MTKRQKPSTPTYIVNCHFEVRPDQQGFIFDFRGNTDGRGFVKLDGYAIVPRELFEAGQAALEAQCEHQVAELMEAFKE